MATDRVNEVDSVFKVSSRINSTFGGNLVDMVRCQKYLEIIESENLCQNAADVGAYLLELLENIGEKHEAVTNVRGRGLMLAFDCPDADYRSKLLDGLLEQNMLGLSCGTRSVRFRPGLIMTREDGAKGMAILDQVLSAL